MVYLVSTYHKSTKCNVGKYTPYVDDIGHVWKLVAAWSSFKSPPANHQLVIQTPPNIHKIPSAKACQSCFAQKKLYLNSISSLYLWTCELPVGTSTFLHWVIGLYTSHTWKVDHFNLIHPLSPLTKGSFQTRNCDDQRRGGSKVVQIVGTWTSQVAVGPGRLGVKWLQLILLIGIHPVNCQPVAITNYPTKHGG